MNRTSNLLGALSMVLADEMREAVNDTLRTTGETAAALIMVGAHPDVHIAEVAEALGLTHSGAVRLVDRLENEELVTRKPGPDSRTVLLRITREGERRRQAALRQRARVLGRALAHLSADEAELLGSCMDKILRGYLTERQQGYRFCRMCDEDTCVPYHCPVEEKWEELFG
ncbi:MarR family winged helix-turn-helix transcriptional regulator [Luethyella okanaganae]|uniref:MarR family winged helix-turn-helix transcriptional regulator n=1 Tax=Luethyella okanaganae TaxID=69372 RepID=A0ABW1VDJ1_9MICO